MYCVLSYEIIYTQENHENNNCITTWALLTKVIGGYLRYEREPRLIEK